MAVGQTIAAQPDVPRVRDFTETLNDIVKVVQDGVDRLNADRAQLVKAVVIGHNADHSAALSAAGSEKERVIHAARNTFLDDGKIEDYQSASAAADAGHAQAVASHAQRTKDQLANFVACFQLALVAFRSAAQTTLGAVEEAVAGASGVDVGSTRLSDPGILKTTIYGKVG